MNNNVTAIELLFDKAEDYSKTSIELFKLQAVDTSADIISSAAVKTVLFFVVTLFLSSINIAIALCIGESLGKYYYGFLILAAFYAIVGLVLYSFRNKWMCF